MSEIMNRNPEGDDASHIEYVDVAPVAGRASGSKKGFFANKTRVLILGVALFAVTSLCIAGYFYMQVRELKKDTTKEAEKELQEVISRVGKLMVLPESEKPTLATVSDPSKLKDQAFFARAELGDKVLIYANAKKAILYSSKLNKILEVAPINLGANQTPPSSTPIPLENPSPAPTVAPKATKTIK